MFNDIKLHGYFGRDPELSEGQGIDGPYKKVLFSIGVSRDYGDGTDWFRCVMYGKRAEVIEKFFRKGSEIFVSGRMESYKPKNDPERTAYIVKVSNFDFCGKGSEKGDFKPVKAEPIPAAPEALDDEDVPF